MDEKKLIDLIDYTLEEKLKTDEKIIKYTFFELKIKYDLTEEELNEFLRFSRNRLENQDYNVYFTGAKYTYAGNEQEVQQNELLVAIKGTYKI